jgi:hypothetical protein
MKGEARAMPGRELVDKLSIYIPQKRLEENKDLASHIGQNRARDSRPAFARRGGNPSSPIVGDSCCAVVLVLRGRGQPRVDADAGSDVHGLTAAPQ